MGFWDHYTGGITDIAVMLPGDHWTHVGTVDTMHMRIQDWDKLKPVLESHPRFDLGKDNFQPDVWESFCDEGDFLEAAVWRGDYGDLIRLLAPFEYREIASKLLPGLSRHENATSVGTAVVMAGVDIARAATAPVDRAALTAQLRLRADREYAMPAASSRVEEAIDQVAALIASVPFAHWKLLAGPALVLRGDRPASEGQIVPGPLDIVLEDTILLLRYGDSITISVSTLTPEMPPS